MRVKDIKAMQLVSKLRLFLALMLFTTLAGGLPSAQAQDNLLVWAQVGGVPPNVTLTGVEMIDRDTAWAVGNDRVEGGSAGFVYRLSRVADRWMVTQDARFDTPLLAIDVVDGSYIWAVGERGLIVRRDSSGWHTMPSPVPDVSLSTLQMVDNGAEGWAGGTAASQGGPSQAVLLHFQNGAWRHEATIVGEGAVSAIHFASGTGWVLLSSNEYRRVDGQVIQQNTVWHNVDGRWTEALAPNPCGGREGCGTWLTDIYAVDAHEAWLTGNTRSNCSFCWTGPVVSHRSGDEWRFAELPELYPGVMPHGGTSLHAIHFADPNHGLFVGHTSYGRDMQSFDEGIVLRYTDGQWSRDPLPLGSAVLYDVSQADAAHALAVGANGRILSYGYGPSELSTPPAAPNGSFAHEAMRAVWERTDRPVAARPAGLQPRTWLWGPQANTAGYREPYAEAPGGMRLVQYFDKSRMEITRPDAPRNQWYVTNGLLVVEMTTGRIQVGDNLFERRLAAYEAVAGDRIEVNPNAPTYGSLVNIAYPNNCERCQQVPRRTGQLVTSVYANWEVREDPNLARYGVTLDAYEEKLGHNIPKVFTDFFAQQGLVYENGRYVRGGLFDWLFVMGLPISEPYWTRVKVGGVEKDVLIQAFERRVLTYTPDNPEGFKVEMGNVGQHYLRWRHGR